MGYIISFLILSHALSTIGVGEKVCCLSVVVRKDYSSAAYIYPSLKLPVIILAFLVSQLKNADV